jgi:hypothetical protein
LGLGTDEQKRERERDYEAAVEVIALNSVFCWLDSLLRMFQI